MSSTELQAIPTVGRNPLLDYTSSGFGSWEEWKQAWESTQNVAQRQNLLRIGYEFGKFHTNWSERFVFYLQVADGHRSETLLRSPDDTNAKIYSYHPRRVLADQAFRAIAKGEAKYVEAEWGDQYPRNSGGSSIESYPECLPLLVWFLRPVDGPGNELVNLAEPGENDHAMELMVRFAVALARKAFWPLPTKQSSFDEVTEFRQQLIALRPQLLPVLRAFGKLNSLLERGVEVDGPSKEELRQAAFGNEGYFEDGKRRPTTLEEAVYLRSPSAIVLTALEPMQKVAKRIQEAKDAKDREVAELEAKLKDLKGH